MIKSMKKQKNEKSRKHMSKQIAAAMKIGKQVY